MITNINASTLRSTYSLSENKEAKANAKLTTSEDGSKNKIEKLKDAIDAGRYKVDLSALATKMADELL